MKTWFCPFLAGVLGFACPAEAEELGDAARAKLTEMVAFVQVATDACRGSDPGSNGGFRVIAMLAKVQPPITAKAIEAKKAELRFVSARLGRAKWCARFASEMHEAVSLSTYSDVRSEMALR